jgi:hypothetical protein
VQLDRAQGIPQISPIAALTITAATRAMPIVSPSSCKPRHQLAIKVKTTLSLSRAMGGSSSVRPEPRLSCEFVARLGEFPGITMLELLEGAFLPCSSSTLITTPIRSFGLATARRTRSYQSDRPA